MQQHTINNVPGTLTRHGVHQTRTGIQAYSRQQWVSEPRPISGYGPGGLFQVEITFDDRHGNGHPYFSMCATVTTTASRRRDDIQAGGQLIEDIARVFPSLAPLHRWHLFDTNAGPMHYLANTVYHAKTGNLDAARRSAAWPEATDAELTAPPEQLTEALLQRHPALLAAFRAAMGDIGLHWTPPPATTNNTDAPGA